MLHLPIWQYIFKLGISNNVASFFLIKKGFTLIEVMVVVIVMGVLAAVAVPKLFGYIAKAKASEVPIAAATYTKLQDAFLSEKTAIASWDLIGYTPPGNGTSNYFKYEGCIVGEINIDVADNGVVGWQAFNLEKLNLCEMNSVWTVTIDPVENKSLSYNHIVSGLGCTYLTHNWDVRAVPAGACEATAQASTPKSSASNSTPTDDPETVDSSNSSESDPTSASGGSSGSNQEEIQKKCDDLKKGGNGNGNNSDPCSKQAKGWVFVVECNMFANKGKANSSGLTVVDMDGDGNADRKKQIHDQMCNQSKSSASSSASGASSTSQSSNANAGSSTSSTPTSTSGGQGGDVGSGGNGGGGSGGGTGSGTGTNTDPENNNAESSGDNGGSLGGTPQNNIIKDQNGNDFDMSKLPEKITYCTDYKGNGYCKNNGSITIDKSECAKYDTSKKMCVELKPADP